MKSQISADAPWLCHLYVPVQPICYFLFQLCLKYFFIDMAEAAENIASGIGNV